MTFFLRSSAEDGQGPLLSTSRLYTTNFRADRKVTQEFWNRSERLHRIKPVMCSVKKGSRVFQRTAAKACKSHQDCEVAHPGWSLTANDIDFLEFVVDDCFCHRRDGFLDMPDCIQLGNVKNALVILMLDQVVSGEHARLLSINRNSGASRFVVAVECSPPAAKLPHMTNRIVCL